MRPLLVGFALLFLVALVTEAGAASFPSDAGYIDVRDFGAMGDGIHDDTEAINAAIRSASADYGRRFWLTPIVYFPDGEYLVSDTISKKVGGRFAAGMVLIGQSRDGTVIRLKDGAAGFGRRSTPKAVIFTSAKLLDGTPTSGGKDYLGKGEGNDAYDNYIENMTVAVGRGNAGAVGIDFLANNMGAVRNVRIVASPGSGAAGISLRRKWVGPALIQDVDIEGFDWGIAAGNTEYGMTLERVRLSGQARGGLSNAGNVLSIRGLTVENARGPAIVNAGKEGLIVVVEGSLRGQGGEAVVNEGHLNLRDLSVSGYSAVLGRPAPALVDGIYDGARWMAQSARPWSLPIEDAPDIPAGDPADWASVAAFGAVADGRTDSTAAIRRAMASGASTIYFPHGRYVISDAIAIPATVNRIEGMMSEIGLSDDRKPTFTHTTGMFVVGQEGLPLAITRLAFDATGKGRQVAVQVRASRVVSLRDVVAAGTVLIDRTPTGGKAFIENVCCGPVEIAGPAGVWARQLNSEGPNVRVANDGAPLWILGVKTERNCTVVDNQGGGRTEILGGLVYIVRPAGDARPTFRNRDGLLAASYAEAAYDPAALYDVHLLDEAKGRAVKAPSLPRRGIARTAPQVVGGE